MEWIGQLGLNIAEEYGKWTVDGQTAGYLQTYREGFRFITIRGA